VSLTTRVLIGLALGFAVGLLISRLPGLGMVPGVLEPVGTLFINAIKMIVMPLVVTSLVVGVASTPDPRSVGRLGRSAIVWFAAIVLASAVIGVAVMPLALSVIAPDSAAVEALRGGSGASDLLERAKAVPTFTQWLTELVPVNPVKAATDGAMLPLIVFSLAFGLALSRIDAERRGQLVAGFRALQDASFVLVRWVLALAPVGVFALAVPLASRLGLEAASAVAWYIVAVCTLCVAFMALVLYPLASVVGRIPVRDFARAALPVQAVAMSSRSSLASLPVMIEQMGGTLGLSPQITGFLLPLSVSTFRAGAGIGITGGVVFVAALYGVHLTLPQLTTVALTTTLVSFSVPGVPFGSIVVMVPVMLAAHLPVEGVGILIAVDAIPDMLRTTTNATGTMAVAAILGGRDRTQPRRPT
jgi:proton glutamate symport protein